MNDLDPKTLARKLRPALSCLVGSGEVSVGTAGNNILIRLSSMVSRLTPEFVVALHDLLEENAFDNFLVDEGEEAACFAVSAGGPTIIKEFDGYRPLFNQVYQILDGR